MKGRNRIKEKCIYYLPMSSHTIVESLYAAPPDILSPVSNEVNDVLVKSATDRYV